MTKFSQNQNYIAYRDLIGLKIWIKQKKQKNMKDFIDAGIIIDETYNLIIASKDKNPENYEKTKKKYVKKNTIFRIILITDSGPSTIEIDGNKLLKRPENRIKNIRKIKRR